MRKREPMPQLLEFDNRRLSKKPELRTIYYPRTYRLLNVPSPYADLAEERK